MRDTCTGCPCLETKDSKPFCFWYQSFVPELEGCGNSFEKKPQHSQSQLEQKVAEEYKNGLYPLEVQLQDDMKKILKEAGIEDEKLLVKLCQIAFIHAYKASKHYSKPEKKKILESLKWFVDEFEPMKAYQEEHFKKAKEIIDDGQL